MESGTKVDRLSNLPDDLIYKILSYVDIKYSIRLSLLSSRWRSIRASMPNLKFSRPNLSYSRYEQLSKISGYHEFVNDVLSARNNKIDVSSVSLHLPTAQDAGLSVNRILDYAFSHNVQKLTISIQHYYILPSRLKSKSLKHLRLIGTSIGWDSDSLPWDLPALTTLRLHYVELHNFSSLLAMCQNLKNLTLEECKVHEYNSDGFVIINSQLRSLTLKKVEWNYVGVVYVGTPQLKNLIFVDTPQREFSGKLTISAHDLTYLRIKGTYFPKLSLDGCPSLEKVDLSISSPKKKNVHRISDVFQRLHSVKSLVLSLEIVKLLSTSEEVISHQPSPFPSLKSLKIYPLQGLKTWPLVCLTHQLKSSLEIFQDEEQEATDEEQDATDEEQDATDEEQDATDEEQEATDEEQDAADEEQEATDEEQDATDEEKEATDEEQDATDEEQDAMDEEQDTTDEEQDATDEEQEAMEIKMSAEVTNYLLGSSSNATFTMVSHEEVRTIKITTVAYRFMAALWKILKKIEAYTTDTKRAKWKKTLADSNYRDFRRQIRPSRHTEEIFRILQNLKLLLTKVLASKRVEMQACFSRLYEKTKTIVINKMIVDMKNQCDIQQGLFSGYLDEIALSS